MEPKDHPKSRFFMLKSVKKEPQRYRVCIENRFRRAPWRQKTERCTLERSLEWTWRRPGRELAPKAPQGDIFIDLGSFLLGLGMICWTILEGIQGYFGNVYFEIFDCILSGNVYFEVFDYILLGNVYFEAFDCILLAMCTLKYSIAYFWQCVL